MRLRIDDEILHCSATQQGEVVIYKYTGDSRIFAMRFDGNRWRWLSDREELDVGMSGDFVPIAWFIPEKTDR